MTINKTIVPLLEQSKTKHPHFADNADHALSVLVEEVGEVASEVRDKATGWKNRAILELLDVIVVCIRYIDMLQGNKNERS